MANDSVHVTYSGKFFRTASPKVVKKAVNAAIIEISKEAVREVKSDLTKGHGKDSGAYRKSIKRKKKGLSSRVFSKNSMISAWLEGTSKRNRNTRFKGYQIWSRAYARVETKADKIRSDLAQVIGRGLN